MNSRGRLAAVGAVAGAALWSCASTTEAPEDRFYRLTPVSVERRLADPLVDGVLRVERVEAFGIYRERAILFSSAESPESMQRHHYHLWVDAPTKLVHAHLAAYLQDAGAADLVAGAEAGRRGDFELEVTLKNFERVLYPSSDVTAAVALKVVARHNRRVVLSENYAAEVPATDGTVAASVKALNEGLARIYLSLLEDLARLPRHSPQASVSGRAGSADPS